MFTLNRNNFVQKPSKLYVCLFCLILIGILYSFIVYNKPLNIWVSSRTCTVQPVVISQQLCYASESDTFSRDYLRQPVINTFSTESIYTNLNDATKNVIMSSNFTNLASFIVRVREALLSRRLQPNARSIPMIFHRPPYRDMVKPSCDGLWMEFGVFQGASLNLIANWKAIYCNHSNQPVYGFDTFTGLPTDWRPGFGQGVFNIGNGTKLNVPKNAVLVKGLFIDTLPVQLQMLDRQYKCHTPVSFVHIDCDIYDGARDALFLLSSRFVKGTIIVFDELFNYPSFEKHEIKAFYELLASSNIRLMPLGTSTDIALNITGDLAIQTFGFVVVS